jgi:hypothetical protein
MIRSDYQIVRSCLLVLTRIFVVSNDQVPHAAGIPSRNESRLTGAINDLKVHARQTQGAANNLQVVKIRQSGLERHNTSRIVIDSLFDRGEVRIDFVRIDDLPIHERVRNGDGARQEPSRQPQRQE